jgi:integrase
MWSLSSGLVRSSLIAGRARLMDRVMMVMAAYGGMRWGELAGLQWHRVDLDQAS